jgi:hypothetical protein
VGVTGVRRLLGQLVEGAEDGLLAALEDQLEPVSREDLGRQVAVAGRLGVPDRRGSVDGAPPGGGGGVLCGGALRVVGDKAAVDVRGEEGMPGVPGLAAVAGAREEETVGDALLEQHLGVVRTSDAVDERGTDLLVQGAVEHELPDVVGE